MTEAGALAPIFFDRKYVESHLGFEPCIEAVRRAMVALSQHATHQLPRTKVGMGDGRILGVMAGALAVDGFFGSKLVSVFANPDHPGHTAHQGVVVLFEPQRGIPVCILDAAAITQIRTAAASAVATDALARSDADVLTVFGHGHQASAHILAINAVRPLRKVIVWGRSLHRARTFALALERLSGLEIAATEDAVAAAGDADIICTLTGAREPILRGAWIKPGVHINLIGSSGPDATEVDQDLLVASRYVVESREAAHAAYSEFLLAKATGAIDDSHVVAEIGEVISNPNLGRINDRDVTMYKSIGHIVQDLAAAVWLYANRAEME